MDNAQVTDPAAGAGAADAGADCRLAIHPEARGRIVNKIMETLQKHLPVSVPEGLRELRKIAVRFEEKNYAAATDQSDYLRNISLKMLSMESQHKTNTQENPQTVQVVQNQRPCYQACSGSTSRAGYLGAGSLKEDLSQMNKNLKDQYLAGLSDIYKLSMKLHEDNTAPAQKPKSLHEVDNFKLILEHSSDSLQMNKRLFVEENIPLYKRHIDSVLNSEEWKPEKTVQQSAGQSPSTSSSGIQLAHGMPSPERGNAKRLRPSLEDDIYSQLILKLDSIVNREEAL